jgi:hypothetical protein
MALRILVASLGCTLLAALAACQTSSRYGAPANVAVGTGLAVAAAAVNRTATHECWAACRPGTICDKATGLCVEPGHRSGPGASPAAGGTQPLTLTAEPFNDGAASGPKPRAPAEPYPAGHEYEVPTAGMADASCAPPPNSSSSSNPGGIACETDGGSTL